MQLSDKMNSIPHCLQDNANPQGKPQIPRESSFNQSTLFSLNNSSFLDHQSSLKGQRKRQVQHNCVSFVKESFMSSRPKSNRELSAPKVKDTNSQKNQIKKQKVKKKSKYNFMKKIINVSKKKLKNAKQFFMKMGNKKTKKVNKKTQKANSTKV